MFTLLVLMLTAFFMASYFITAQVVESVRVAIAPAPEETWERFSPAVCAILNVAYMNGRAVFLQEDSTPLMYCA